MHLSFTLNSNQTLVKKNTYDMLHIIFKKCFLVSIGPEKLLNFVDLKQIFILVFILNIFPNMHLTALQSDPCSSMSCQVTDVTRTEQCLWQHEEISIMIEFHSVRDNLPRFPNYCPFWESGKGNWHAERDQILCCLLWHAQGHVTGPALFLSSINGLTKSINNSLSLGCILSSFDHATLKCPSPKIFYFLIWNYTLSK